MNQLHWDEPDEDAHDTTGLLWLASDADHPYLRWRGRLGLPGFALIGKEHLFELVRLSEAGASKEEIDLFLQSIIDQTIADEARLREN